MNDLEKKSAFARYAHSFQTVTRPGLARIAHMLSLLGNPERACRCIHIAGTNGKGSVAAFLDTILSKEGYRVGRFTSPNLVRVNERMKVAGEDIDDIEMQSLFDSLVETAERTERALGGDRPTQFEIWTAAAFLWFAQKKCDYVVLETGMGGEFDATNVIEENVCAVLTRIDLDHTEYLGRTEAEIAKTKSGVLKEKCTQRKAFSVEQSQDAMTVIEERAAALGLALEKVVPLQTRGNQGLFEEVEWKGTRLLLSLGGLHQCENAALAAAVAEDMGISDESIVYGLSHARHPARLELLRKDPILIYDGAHNPNGVRALCASLDRAKISSLCIVFACMKDKEIGESLALLKRYASRFLFTTVQGNPRAETPEGLATRAATLGVEGTSVSTLEEALRLCEHENTLVCGSLYLYADLPQNFLVL